MKVKGYSYHREYSFPISRDPPEGGTVGGLVSHWNIEVFPISRDPPEGGTTSTMVLYTMQSRSFQFLGIPPKGEHGRPGLPLFCTGFVSNF